MLFYEISFVHGCVKKYNSFENHRDKSLLKVFRNTVSVIRYEVVLLTGIPNDISARVELPRVRRNLKVGGRGIIEKLRYRLALCYSPDSPAVAQSALGVDFRLGSQRLHLTRAFAGSMASHPRAIKRNCTPGVLVSSEAERNQPGLSGHAKIRICRELQSRFV